MKSNESAENYLETILILSKKKPVVRSVDIADVVAIASYVSNSEKNPLESQGMINGDVQGNGNGINANDALAVQQFLANIITEL